MLYLHTKANGPKVDGDAGPKYNSKNDGCNSDSKIPIEVMLKLNQGKIIDAT